MSEDDMTSGPVEPGVNVPRGTQGDEAGGGPRLLGVEGDSGWPAGNRGARRRAERRRRRRQAGFLRAALVLGVVVVAALSAALAVSAAQRARGTGAVVAAPILSSTGGGSQAGVASSTTATSMPPTTTTSKPSLEPGDTRIAGTHYGPINTEYAGVTMFRGNGSRTYYGEGPVPRDPKILWKFGPMSGLSTHKGQPKVWTGTGWTGQPAVFEREGKTWVGFGSYDKYVHFLDADTGEKVYPSFQGGNIFKGSLTVDPDGYPLVFMGCRDHEWKVIAIDRDKPTQLWSMNAHDVQVIWNNDWDGNVVIRNDYAFVPGENSHFFIVKLNRGYDENGKVKVAPQVVLDFPGWTAELFKAIGDQETSIENSPALVGDRVYFCNSGGLLHGLDVSATLKALEPGEEPAGGRDSYPVVFSFWTGDDTDATIVVDDEGFLYVCMELQRFLPRAAEVGQIIKLDPRKNKEGDNPVVWSVPVTKRASDGLSGVWATPALYKDMLYVSTHPGSLLGIDRMSGDVVWKKPLPEHAWSSPIVADERLVVCDTKGVIHAYDVSDTRVDPPEVWSLQIPSAGAIESSPVVWKGRIYVGSRDGYLYCIGDE